MTIQKFIEKWNGKYCEVAGTSNALNQCVDLANAYLRDVLGQPIVEWTNAKDFPLKIGDKFEYILNTPTGVPKEGDLVVWGGTYGHIAIFVDGGVNTFRSFDQNYPTGSPCHIQSHNYSSVTGWLRFKEHTGIEVGPEVIQNSDNWIDFLYHTGLTNNKDIVKREWDKYVAYEDVVRDKDKELVLLNSQLQETQEKAEKLEGRIDTLLDDFDGLKNNYSASEEALTVAVSQLEQLRRENDDLKKTKPVVGKLGFWQHIKLAFDSWLNK